MDLRYLNFADRQCVHCIRFDHSIHTDGIHGNCGDVSIRRFSFRRVVMHWHVVLGVCLRMQVTPATKEFQNLPPERALVDFALLNLVLHLVIMNLWS
ncbi:hypothetical protein M758_1G176300 [Ceratodon purpureus]|nr:hypothetical protein M758_1G176300 [Ceratodon purpureus]